MEKRVVRDHLKKDIWADSEYYRQIEMREHYDHPGFLLGVKTSQNSDIILDVGCGDGSKLAKLGSKNTKRFGCEISEEAVRVGKKKYPTITFSVFDGSTLPFSSTMFDLVTSFFVLEHTDNPSELIIDMVRVLKPKGQLLLVAPNFGSPNRASPPYVGNRYRKLLSGIVNDLVPERHQLNWSKVTPTVSSMKEFMPDLDTTIEPYLGSLKLFLDNLGLSVKVADSCWQLDASSKRILQRIFSRLGKKGIWPFSLWGPHLVILAQKL